MKPHDLIIQRQNLIENYMLKRTYKTGIKTSIATSNKEVYLNTRIIAPSCCKLV